MQKPYLRLPYIICYLCALVLGMKQLREPDVWWQLLSGRWMLENGEITRTDMFSYTMQGAKWINVKWLYEIIIASLEKSFGPHCVLLLQAGINVLMVYLLLRILTYFTKHLGTQVSTFCSVIAVLLFLALSEFRMTGRPEMISHFMTVLYMFILWKGEGYTWKKIFWLIPLQCIWANMHEGYPVGIIIIGTYTVGAFISYIINKEKEKLQQATRLGVILAAAVVAIVINPNTVQLWLQPFEIYRQLGANKFTTELLSFTQSQYWTIQAYIHIALLLAVMLFWMYKIVTRKTNGLKFTPLLVGYLLSIPLLGYLSLSAYRNIPFAQIALFPTVPVMLLWLVGKLKLNNKQFYINAAKKTVVISTVVAAAFYISVVTNTFYKATASVNRYGMHINILQNPVGAADFIRSQNLKGPAFSDYFISSYLLWDNYPNFKSFIDLRDLDVFPSKFFDRYFDIYHQPSNFRKEDSLYNFNYVVLNTSQLKPLQQLLYWSEGYNVVYIDPVSIIFLKEKPENYDLNHNLQVQRLFTWPQAPVDPQWAELLTKLLNPAAEYEEEDEKYAPLHAGLYYNMVGNYGIAAKLLLPGVKTDLADNARALSTIGTTYMEETSFVNNAEEYKIKMDSARYYFNRAIEIDDKNSSTWLGLATMSVMENDYETAKRYLDKCLKLDKSNDYIYYMNGMCARNLWNSKNDPSYVKEVISSMEKSLNINSVNPKAHLYLAEAYWHVGDRDKARSEMTHTLKPDIPWADYEKELLDRMIQLTGMKEYNSSMDLIKNEAE